MFFIAYVFFSKELYWTGNLKSDVISLKYIGQIGSSFNILTSLFAGLAFGAIIVTIKVQQQEFIETRKEIERQKFDNKFFQMLNQFNKISNDLILKNSNNNDIKGKLVFETLNEKFNDSILEAYEIDLEEKSIKDDKSLYLNEIFIEFNDDHDTTFKYIFLNLFQILNYIDSQIGEESQAKEYTNILRAQLTKYELILLAHNAIGVQSFTTNRYQELLEKYEFFEHLRYQDFHEKPEIVSIINSILEKFDAKAFGKNEGLFKSIKSNDKYFTQ